MRKKIISLLLSVLVLFIYFSFFQHNFTEAACTSVKAYKKTACKSINPSGFGECYSCNGINNTDPNCAWASEGAIGCQDAQNIVGTSCGKKLDGTDQFCNVYYSNTCENRCDPTNTPTLTPSPTLTLTPTITPSPTITLTPTPTIPASCVCQATGFCDSTCAFSGRASGTGNTIKCSYLDGELPTYASTIDGNSWCRRPVRTVGDVDGNGSVNSNDYLYFVSAFYNGTIPIAVNPDVNGDGAISMVDRDIIQANIQ